MLIVVAFDLLAVVMSADKAADFGTFRKEFDAECADERNGIRDSLKGAARKQWDACAVLKKDETARPPKRDELRDANRTGKLTGDAQAAFRRLELTYKVTSQAATIVKIALAYAEGFANALDLFWDGKLSALRLYNVALKLQTSKGKESNPDARRSPKGKGKDKQDSAAQILVDARERFLKIGNLAAANAIVAVANRLSVTVRGNKFRKLSKLDVQTTQEK
jgi:hypothetical protein